MEGDSYQTNEIFIDCHKCHEKNKVRDMTECWGVAGESAAFKDACGCFLMEAVLQGQCGGWEPREDTVLRVQAADDLRLREWREVKPERWMSWGVSAELWGLWVFEALPRFSHQ